MTRPDQREDHTSSFMMDEIPDSALNRSDLLAINDALKALGELDPRKEQIVELRFFGGLSVEKTAEVLEISPRSILRDWKLAKAWLQRELSTRT